MDRSLTTAPLCERAPSHDRFKPSPRYWDGSDKSREGTLSRPVRCTVVGERSNDVLDQDWQSAAFLVLHAPACFLPTHSARSHSARQQQIVSLIELMEDFLNPFLGIFRIVSCIASECVHAPVLLSISIHSTWQSMMVVTIEKQSKTEPYPFTRTLSFLADGVFRNDWYFWT